MSISENTKNGGLLKSGGGDDESWMENFVIKGKYILQDTDLGEKRASETTAPESAAEETTVNKSVVEWIADYFCGPMPENPEGEI